MNVLQGNLKVFLVLLDYEKIDNASLSVPQTWCLAHPVSGRGITP